MWSNCDMPDIVLGVSVPGGNELTEGSWHALTYLVDFMV